MNVLWHSNTDWEKNWAKYSQLYFKSLHTQTIKAFEAAQAECVDQDQMGQFNQVWGCYERKKLRFWRLHGEDMQNFCNAMLEEVGCGQQCVWSEKGPTFNFNTRKLWKHDSSEDVQVLDWKVKIGAIPTPIKKISPQIAPQNFYK